MKRLTHELADSPFLFHWLRKLPEANYRATKARLSALRDRIAPERVIDLGCGTGEFAALFAPAGYLGLDIHPGYVRFAARAHRQHRFVCADALGWTGDGRPFDLALTNGVLHHHDDASAGSFLQAALRHTRPGGWLVVIEDTHLPGRPAAALVHALDEGAFVRTPDAWRKLVGACASIAHEETYVSGICPYHLMVARKA
ncbi:MAG: class I SAM-dependent methyltransferase [Myxococcota bacterium]